MTDNRILDGGLKPCPFCGGKAERATLEDGENAGGDVIFCTGICGASSHVEFGRKENLVSLWNTRTPQPAPDGDWVMVETRRADANWNECERLRAILTRHGISYDAE